jgi:hypothetical protein
MVTNIVLYVVANALYLRARSTLPASIDVDTHLFLPELRSSLSLHTSGINIEACNTFINWFKVLLYMKLDPTFSALTDTMELASADMFGFGVCFLTVFYGFVQAHTMIFGRILENYRTLGSSVLT